MSKINLRKQTSASVSNPGAGQLSVYFDNDGLMTSKDELGNIITYGTLSGLTSEINTAINNQKGIANGIASLGADSKIPASQLPAISNSSIFVVASQAAMLALSAQTGDLAIRTDLSQTFGLSATDPTVLANWKMLLTPADTVSSVNGLTGAVVLTKNNVGLSNVDNTSDATKNASVSTLTNKTLSSPVINTPTGIVKGDVGLSAVDNTSDANKPVSTAQASAVAAAQAFAIQRVNHTGTQLSSTISDFASASSAASPVQSVSGRTGAVVLTKSDVGLSLSDNTSDVNKPVSTAQAAANTAVQSFAIQRNNHTGTQLATTISDFNAQSAAAAPVQSVAGRTGAVVLTKADVGLVNVDNTSDAAKNTAVATLTNKTLTSPVINTPTGITKTDVGLPSVDNTSDVNKPVSTAQASANSVVQSFSIQRANHTGTQLASTISDFSTAADARITAQKGMANGIASLDATSKIPIAMLPAIAVTDTFVVASQAAMLALTAQTGDLAVRSDISQTYILTTNDPTVLANWQILMTPTGAVSSVNGFTGAVVLTKADIGLLNADNTSDVNKPVSTAQAAANTSVQSFAIQRANHTGTQLASTISNFNTAASAAAPVQSVAGRTGVVVLTKTDVALANVVNLDTSTTANITDSLNKRFVTDTQKAAIATVGNYTNITSATLSTTSVATTPSIVSTMTLSPVAGTHKVTFNSQYSTTAASMTAQAASDLTAAYNSIMALAATGTHILVFGAETITPGVYDVPGAGSITTATTVTLDAQGNSNAIFIFRNTGAFSTGASAVVTLINGAQASNVFWVAQGAITLGANTNLTGTLLSLVAVSTAAGCTVNGRLSSTGGAVGIATSTVTKPTTASQINLGTFASFAMFTNSGGASAAGTCTVTGDVGTNAGAITGFETSTVNGNFYTSASISSVFTLSIYSNGVLVVNSSRSIIASQSTNAAVASLDALVTTLAGQSIDIRVKVDSGTFTTGNRTFTTVQVG